MLELIQIMLSPLNLLYEMIVGVRNALFDKGLLKSEKVNAKVVSIGNITVGGSGKTPAVIYVAKVLKSKGIKVGVLSRGYRRKAKGYLLVSDGNKIFTSVDECGDEIYLVAKECGVPAAVCERRVEGAERFLDDVELDVIVLDDAFQHRWIQRDMDALLFDQRFLLKVKSREQKLLPGGLMREPFSSIRRANAIIVNRKFAPKKELPKFFKELTAGKDVFYAFYKANEIVDLKTGETFELKEFSGQKSFVVCGIAKPHSFLAILEENNIDISNRKLFPDHKNYTLKEVEQIRAAFYKTNSYSVITTQKDAVKLSKYLRELDDIDIYFIRIEIDFDEREAFNSKIFNSINLQGGKNV